MKSNPERAAAKEHLRRIKKTGDAEAIKKAKQLLAETKR